MTITLPRARTLRDLPVAAIGGLLASVAVAAWWQATCSVNTDESWLLDVAGRVYDGGRFYVDFTEVNPPASVLLYVPAVALARATLLSPINAVRLLVALAFCCSLGLATAILRPAGLLRKQAGPTLLAIATAALILLPMYAFGQREHIAVLACLPLLAAVGARAAGHRPALWLAALAGLGGGVALSIKPMFGLGFVGPFAFLAITTNWRDVLRWTEAWVAAAVAMTYGVGVLLFCPIFVSTMLPIAVAVYVPVRLPVVALLVSPGFVIWALLTGLALAGRRHADASRGLATILVLSAAGFQLVALQQGKGFAYHSYPAIALALLAAALPLARRAALPRAQWLDAALVAFALLCGVVFFTRHYDPLEWSPGLARAMREVAPHPRTMAISAELALGHPLVESIGGRWVGRTSSTWIGGNAYAIAGGPSKVGALARYVDWERDIVAADVAHERPDIILIDDTGWMNWIAGSPAMAGAFADYRLKGTYGAVALWTRRDLPP